MHVHNHTGVQITISGICINVMRKFRSRSSHACIRGKPVLDRLARLALCAPDGPYLPAAPLFLIGGGSGVELDVALDAHLLDQVELTIKEVLMFFFIHQDLE